MKIIAKNVETLQTQRSDAAMSAIHNIGKLYTSDRQSGSTRPVGYATNLAQQVSVQDIEDVSPPGVVPTISHHMSLMNGHIGGTKTDPTANQTAKLNGGQRLVANGKPSFRNMLNDAEDPIDSYM